MQNTRLSDPVDKMRVFAIEIGDQIMRKCNAITGIVATVLAGAAMVMTAPSASAEPTVARVVYAPNTDGSWDVVEGDWRAIPSNGSATVSIVQPESGSAGYAAKLASSLSVHAKAPVSQERAQAWRGAARVVVSWAAGN